jgi:hypothetical protein
MITIDSTLEKHGLTQDELPKSVRNKIAHLAELHADIEASKADLETEDDAEVKKEMQDTIAQGGAYAKELEEEIIERIEELKAKDDGEPTPAASTSTPQAKTDNQGQPKKSGAALGWIVGGVLLVLTLGAVNTMSKK